MFLPYKRYVMILIFLGKDMEQIQDCISAMNYYYDSNMISDILREITLFISLPIKNMIDNKISLAINDENCIGFLKHFEVFEMYHYIKTNGNNNNNNPSYFKWCQDALWIVENMKIMAPVNLFIFNGDSNENILDFLTFKYRKRISIEAIDLYKKIFWDCQEIDAEDAIKYCLAFHGNTIILKENIVTSEKEIKVPSDYKDLNSSEYVKWKMGYKNVPVPTTKQFFDDVKRDCAYTYQEIMNRVDFKTKSTRTIKSPDGAIVSDEVTINSKDCIDAKYHLVNKVLKVYTEVEDRMPTEDETSEDFFKKMQNIEIKYEDVNKKILRIEDCPQILNDIREDLP
jgi:hypothetical protein